MRCPVCQEPLISVEFQEVELDTCLACHGIWLDTDELSFLLEDRSLSEGFISSGNPELSKGEKKRLCPICDKPMKKLVTTGSNPVVHDYCPKGHGTWFDRGELVSVIEQGVEGGSTMAVIQWLRNLFSECNRIS